MGTRPSFSPSYGTQAVLPLCSNPQHGNPPAHLSPLLWAVRTTSFVPERTQLHSSPPSSDPLSVFPLLNHISIQARPRPCMPSPHDFPFFPLQFSQSILVLDRLLFFPLLHSTWRHRLPRQTRYSSHAPNIRQSRTTGHTTPLSQSTLSLLSLVLPLAIPMVTSVYTLDRCHITCNPLCT